jgi:hypothetical protein
MYMIICLHLKNSHNRHISNSWLRNDVIQYTYIYMFITNICTKFYLCRSSGSFFIVKLTKIKENTSFMKMGGGQLQKLKYTVARM